jgi:hypothetical protein
LDFDFQALQALCDSIFVKGIGRMDCEMTSSLTCQVLPSSKLFLLTVLKDSGTKISPHSTDRENG